jgi:hypothetical protein
MILTVFAFQMIVLITLAIAVVNHSSFATCAARATGFPDRRKLVQNYLMLHKSSCSRIVRYREQKKHQIEGVGIERSRRRASGAVPCRSLFEPRPRLKFGLVASLERHADSALFTPYNAAAPTQMIAHYGEREFVGNGLCIWNVKGGSGL